MEEGLFILLGASLGTLMTFACRHQDLAPLMLGVVVKLGVSIGLAIPVYLWFLSPDGVVQSALASLSASAATHEMSAREALSMISCMILGSFALSVVLIRVRRMTVQETPESGVDLSQNHGRFLASAAPIV